jgi:hypothetical protein
VSWWRRRAEAEERGTGEREPDEVLRRIDDRQDRIDELERWARKEARVNSFSERMRRGMGGGG